MTRRYLTQVQGLCLAPTRSSYLPGHTNRSESNHPAKAVQKQSLDIKSVQKEAVMSYIDRVGQGGPQGIPPSRCSSRNISTPSPQQRMVTVQRPLGITSHIHLKPIKKQHPSQLSAELQPPQVETDLGRVNPSHNPTSKATPA